LIFVVFAFWKRWQNFKWNHQHLLNYMHTCGEYRSYLYMKLWSERIIPCRVIIMINFKLVRVIELFALLPSLHHITRLPSNLFKTLTFSCWHQKGYPKLNYKTFLWIIWLFKSKLVFLIIRNITKLQNSAFCYAPCTEIFSRFDFSFPCNIYIRKPCGTTNIPLDQEHCGACSLL